MEKISRVETFPNLVVSKEPATVYDVACKSIPELVYLIMQRLNETIEHMNKNDATLQDHLDYVLQQLEEFYLKFDENLRQEIQIVLQAWIEDGTLEQVISQLVENRAVYPSIAALQQAPNIFQLGAIVELQGYHYAGDGAGHKRIIADKDDGSGVAVGNKWANLIFDRDGTSLNEERVNVKDYFYLVENDDWAPIVRKLLQTNNYLYFPKGTYNFKSADPENPECVISIDNNDTKIYGDGRQATRLNAAVAANNFFGAKESTEAVAGLKFENLFIHGNKQVDYCFNFENRWTTQLKMSNLVVHGAKDTSCKVPTFVSVIEFCWFGQAKTGFHLMMKEGTRSTSTTMNSVFTLDCSENGYILETTYSTLVSCASDRNTVGYYVKNSKGLSLVGCGAEATKQVLKADAWWGGSIQDFYGLENGSDNISAHFSFGSAVDITISGIHSQSWVGSSKKLELTASNYGGENITILDNSISPDDCKFISNWGFKNPIKFIRGATNRNRTIEITTFDQLKDELSKLPKEVNTDVVFNIAGTLTQTSEIVMEDFTGNGTITFKGGAISGYSQWKLFEILNSTPAFIFKDMTISHSFNSNQQLMILCSNSKIGVDNCVFKNESGGKGGAAVRATNLSTAIISESTTTEGAFGSDGHYTAWSADGTSVVSKK